MDLKTKQTGFIFIFITGLQLVPQQCRTLLFILWMLKNSPYVFPEIALCRRNRTLMQNKTKKHSLTPQNTSVDWRHIDCANTINPNGHCFCLPGQLPVPRLYNTFDEWVTTQTAVHFLHKELSSSDESKFLGWVKTPKKAEKVSAERIKNVDYNQTKEENGCEERKRKLLTDSLKPPTASCARRLSLLLGTPQPCLLSPKCCHPLHNLKN